MFGVIDWDTILSGALTTADPVGSLTGGIETVAPVVIGVAALLLVFNRIKGLVH
jgi:hypothetical protein